MTRNQEEKEKSLAELQMFTGLALQVIIMSQFTEQSFKAFHQWTPCCKC